MLAASQRPKVNRKVVPIVLRNVPLIMKQARQVHEKLPRHTQRWLDKDDLVQEGIIASICDHRYDPRKKTKYTTFMYMVLDCVYKNEVLDKYYAEKRFDGKTSAIEDLLPGWDRKFSTEEPADISGSEKLPEPEVEMALYVKWVFPLLFKRASPILQRKLYELLVTPTETKFHTSGRRFKNIQEEFLALCRHYKLGYRECLFAVRSTYVKAKVARLYKEFRTIYQ